MSPDLVQLKTDVPRPELPIESLNPMLENIDPATPPPVKFQVITREGQEIVVGRLKIQTPTGHAFILRRFDTNAVSASTMFRAAFPGVSDEREKAEVNYLKAAYEHNGANGGGNLRLAGMWVPPAAAMHIAKKYHLGTILSPLVNAVPDNKGVYRKSQRASAENGAVSSPSAPPPPYYPNAPNKRRRGESPGETTTPSASLPTLSQTTALPISTRTRSSASPVRQTPFTRQSASPSRASTRQTRQSTTTATAPIAPLVIVEPTIAEVDESLAEEGPSNANIEDEIEQSKALVAALKAATASSSLPIESATYKRGLNDEPASLTLNLAKKPDVAELQLQRQIATNSRVTMTPTRKAAAWGALAFSIGLGAATLLPNFF